MSAASTMPCLRTPEIGKKSLHSKLNKCCSRSATIMPIKSDVQFPQGFRFAYIVLAYSPTSTPLLRWRNPLSGGAVEPCIPVAVYMADYQGSSCPEPLGYMAAPHKCCYGGIFLMAWLILQCPAHEGPSCFLHGSKE